MTSLFAGHRHAHMPSRRDVLTGLGALGAGALLSNLTRATLTAQVPGDRIDVHQHYVSPDYYALLTKKNAASPVPGFGIWKDYSPQKNLDAMDKAGIATAMLSPTAPGVFFGDMTSLTENMEARKIAREMNEYAAAKMV